MVRTRKHAPGGGRQVHRGGVARLKRTATFFHRAQRRAQDPGQNAGRVQGTLLAVAALVLPLRAPGALAYLWPLALLLTACASTVPWPPQDGSCVEAYKRPGRRRPWHYWINGNSATHDEVERTVYDTPSLRAKVRRNEVASIAGPTLVFTGELGAVSGIAVAAVRREPLFSLISVAGVAAAVAGVILLMTNEDPFRGAVVAFNARARRRGFCNDRPRPLPLPTAPSAEPPAEIVVSPAPPEGLPVLPDRGWTP